MTPKESTKISKIFQENPGDEGQDWLSEQEGQSTPESQPAQEGQLALDAYQNEDSVIIKAPIAGVNPEDLEVSIGEGIVTIRGERKKETEVKNENYLAQECYWGIFSRQITLPKDCDTEKAEARLKNGVLTIEIPKEPKSKTKVLKIAKEED